MHTDIRDVDYAALSAYTTNHGIQEAARRGYEEAHSIFAFLGITALQMYGPVTRLPGISTWYAETTEDDNNNESSAGSSSDFDDYQRLLEDVEDLEPTLEHDKRKLMQARFAMIALSIDEQSEM
jgi:hypothetical protein